MAAAQSIPTTVPVAWPEIHEGTSTGAALAGAKLCSYAAGTSTPLATFADYTGKSYNTNPVTLDANGRASVWIGSLYYKFVLRTGGTAYPASDACTTGTVVWTQDYVADAGMILGAYNGALTRSTLTLTATTNQIILNSTGYTGTITATPTGTRVWILPDASDTLIGKATTDTLLNKTLDTASNTFKLNGTEITTASDLSTALGPGTHWFTAADASQIGLSAGDGSDGTVYVLPLALGASGQVLATDGTGNTSWVPRVTVSDGGAAAGANTDITSLSAVSSITHTGTGELTITSGTIGSNGITLNTRGDPVRVTGGSAAPGAIVIEGQTAGYGGFTVQDSGGYHIWTLPTTDGTASYVLETDGSNHLGWVANVPVPDFEALQAKVASLEARIAQLEALLKAK